jgi:hypothetical protein
LEGSRLKKSTDDRLQKSMTQPLLAPLPEAFDFLLILALISLHAFNIRLHLPVQKN